MKSSDMGAFFAIILLGLSLFSALLLESRMQTHYILELVLIVIGIILTFGILFGLWIDEPWAFPLSTILFSASVVNIVWMFKLTNSFIVSAFALLVNIAGVVICIASMERPTPWSELETYDAKKRKK